MKFLIVDCNYIGTPEGYLQLEFSESIEDVYTLNSAEWLYLSESEIEALDTSNLYLVDSGDTGFIISLLPGFDPRWPGGATFNARILADEYFNGSFYAGSHKDCYDSEKASIESLNERFPGYVVKYFAYEIPGWVNTQVVKGASWEEASQWDGPYIETAHSIREVSFKEYKEILDSHQQPASPGYF